MIKNLLIFTTTLLLVSCTASISVKAQDMSGDPEIYQETLPPAPPGILAPEKDKTDIPRNPSMQAQRIPCDTEEYVINLLTNENNEKKLFSAEGLFYMIPPGRSPQFAQPFKSPVSFYVDQNSGKWTLVVHSNGMACLITNGTQFDPFSG